MTPEEIQRIIEGMLAVQKELQNSQLKLREDIAANTDAIRELRIGITDLKEISQRHERRIEQLIGYSITGEADHLDLLGRLQSLERRVNRLEQGDESS